MTEVRGHFEIYSRTGRLLDSCLTRERAEQLLGVWFNAQCVIQVDVNGNRTVVAERKELAGVLLAKVKE